MAGGTDADGAPAARIKRQPAPEDDSQPPLVCHDVRQLSCADFALSLPGTGYRPRTASQPSECAGRPSSIRRGLAALQSPLGSRKLLMETTDVGNAALSGWPAVLVRFGGGSRTDRACHPARGGSFDQNAAGGLAPSLISGPTIDWSARGRRHKGIAVAERGTIARAPRPSRSHLVTHGGARLAD